jgi:hypothetical protein
VIRCFAWRSVFQLRITLTSGGPGLARWFAFLHAVRNHEAPPPAIATLRESI